MSNPFGTPMTRDWITDLEEVTNFWNLSDQLKLIAHTASQESVSPWGMLAQVQRNHTARVSPEHRAPMMAMSGYVALVDDGDNSARAIITVASKMCDVYLSGRGDSVDGIIDSIAYSDDTDDDGYRTPLPKVKFLNHVAVFESAVLPRLNRLDASTLETMWTGESVCGGKKNRVILPSGSYRVHGTWNLTPMTAAPMWKLLNCELPYLMLWAPSTEHRVGDRTPPRVKPPKGVTLALPVWGSGDNPYGVFSSYIDTFPNPVLVGITEPLREWMAERRDDLDVMLDTEPCCAPDIPAITAHSSTTRLVWKQTIMMAWLHGRREPNSTDLDLALTQVEVSRATAASAWAAMNGERVPGLLV
jgi:hypothetical protein